MSKKNIAWCPVCDFHWNPLTLVIEIVFKTRGEDMPNEVFFKSCEFLAKVYLGGMLPMKDGSWVNCSQFTTMKNLSALANEKSSIKNEKPDFLQNPVSSIQYPVSSIQYPVSSIQYPVSSIQYPESCQVLIKS
jgi:hypothetical protein